jgi:predicted nucleic acid-binding protein
MSIDRNTLLFFDASRLIAAAGSPTGGSGFLLAVCARGLLRAACSQPVLVEAERNVVAKMKSEALSNYHRILASTPFVIAPVPSEEERRFLKGVVEEKDEHVLAAALAVEAPFLIALDHGLMAGVNEVELDIRALSPGGFIKTIIPSHVDYPKVRGESRQ